MATRFLPQITAVLPVAIIAGGKGTRIASIAGDLPKALVPVADAPFLDHQLRLLARDGARKIVLCTGYGAEAIRAFAGDGRSWGVEVTYSDDGGRALGTGGALRKALPQLGDTFLTIYGDAILQCDLPAIVATLGERDLGVMSVFENHDRWLPSNVRVARGRVVAYDKEAPRGSMTHIDYGINVFRRDAFAAFEERDAFDLAEIHRAAIARDALRAFPCERRWFEIGSLEGLQETERFLRAKHS